MHLSRPLRLLPALLLAVPAGALIPASASAAALPVCADLQVGSPSVSPQQPIAGQPATVSVPVLNAGSCDAQGFVVQWKITPYATSGPSDAVPFLGAGQSTVVSLPYTFPKAGNFESIAIVDTHNDIAETNEKNNTQILPVTVVPSTVDLSVSGLSTSPVPPVQGRVETTSITVHNSGNTAAGPFRLKWVPKPFAAAIVKQIPGLAAGASQTYPFDYTYQRAGTFRSTVFVDSSYAVRETNERNNRLVTSILVDPPKPDLTLSGLSITPALPIPGTVTTAHVTVSNVGNSPAESFLVSWQPQPLATPVTKQINGLGVGGSQVVDLPYVFASSGSFNGTITADSTGVVPEIDEANNSLPTTVLLSPNTVDLSVTDVSVTPDSPQIESFVANSGSATQGEPATVDITVTNSGNTDSGAFLVDWNPDANYVVSPSLSTVTKQVDNLPAGQSTHVVFTYAYPAFGNFSTLTTVDPRNTVAETNEANNQALLPVTVAPANVDLYVTSCSVSPGSIKRFGQATATITVVNNGTFPSGPTTVAWNPTGSSGFSPSAAIPALTPGGSRTVQLKSTFWSLGTFTGAATVDPNNRVVEPYGEGNNTSSCSPISVTPLQQQ